MNLGVKDNIMHLHAFIYCTFFMRFVFIKRAMKVHVYCMSRFTQFVCLSCVRDREEQLVRLRESQRQQAQQADSALENFKKQVELSAQKTYAEMKQQVSTEGT